MWLYSPVRSLSCLMQRKRMGVWFRPGWSWSWLARRFWNGRANFGADFSPASICCFVARSIWRVNRWVFKFILAVFHWSKREKVEFCWRCGFFFRMLLAFSCTFPSLFLSISLFHQVHDSARCHSPIGWGHWWQPQLPFSTPVSTSHSCLCHDTMCPRFFNKSGRKGIWRNPGLLSSCTLLPGDVYVPLGLRDNQPSSHVEHYHLQWS